MPMNELADEKIDPTTGKKGPKVQVVGHGHDITEAEKQAGGIMVNGVLHDFKTPMSKTTARQLLNQDMEIARGRASKAFPGFENMDKRDQFLLSELTYNAGNVSSRSWPKLHKAITQMKPGPARQAEIAKQARRHYTDRKGNKTYLDSRLKEILDIYKNEA